MPMQCDLRSIDDGMKLAAPLPSAVGACSDFHLRLVIAIKKPCWHPRDGSWLFCCGAKVRSLPEAAASRTASTSPQASEASFAGWPHNAASK